MQIIIQDDGSCTGRGKPPVPKEQVSAAAAGMLLAGWIESLKAHPARSYSADWQPC